MSDKIFLISYLITVKIPRPRCIVPNVYTWRTEVEDTLLVYADSYETACGKIKASYKEILSQYLDASYKFTNKTIGL